MEKNHYRRDGETPRPSRPEGRRPRKQFTKGTPVQDDERRSYHTDGERPRKPFPKEGRPAGKPHAKEGRPFDPERKPGFKKAGPKGEGKPYPKPRKPRLKGQLAPRDPDTPQPNPLRPTYAEKGLTRLNKYISNAGICSRREADKLIESGAVTVNGQVVTLMGYLVKEGDIVNYGGETLRSEPRRYFLLNKPKGYITTMDDPQERQTVMELVASACKERIYPVGRLDRNTTGLLLFTNDGEMAKKLTHPSTGVFKVYKVELDKPVSKEDMQKMLDGIELEDGVIAVDDVAYDYNPAERKGVDKRIVGVQLHSGKNRIVRRIFESMGYTVHKLDRTVFAGLTKKDLPRGRYRELTEREVNFLKMI